MRRALFLLLLLALAACGGGGDDNTPSATEAAPQETAAGTNPAQVSDPNSLPPEILTALHSQTQPTNAAVGGQLPFQIPGAGGNSPIGEPSGEAVTDFSTLEPGALVALSGQLNMVTTEGGQSQFILSDPLGNEVVVNIAMPLLQGAIGQRIQLTGTLSDTEDAEGRLVLHNPELGGGNPSGLPEFLQGLSQQLQTTAPPTNQLPVDSPLQALNPSALDIQLEPGLTALQSYDALIAALGQEALAGLNWVSITGNADVGWAIQFDNPDDPYGVEYIIASDGSVQTRPIPLQSIEGATVTPMERARVMVDSPQVVEQLEAQQGLLTLRAANPDEYYWLVVGTENTLLATDE